MKRSNRWTLAAAAGGVCWVGAGCASEPGGQGEARPYAPAIAGRSVVFAGGDGAGESQGERQGERVKVEEVAGSVDVYAERLLASMKGEGEGEERSAVLLPEPPGSPPPPPGGDAAAAMAAVDAGGGAMHEASDQRPDAMVVPPGAGAGAGAVGSLSRFALVAGLREDLASDEAMTPMQRAAAAVGLRLATGGLGFDDAERVDGLDARERESVEALERLVQASAARLVATGAFDADAAAEVAGSVWGDQPVRVRGERLCRRVDGFGQYEPRADGPLMAGREHPMVLYLEIDRFVAEFTSADGFEVRLEQEVTLMDSRDGQVVWRSGDVEVVDVSRNRRRDFYTVQLVRLPATLATGRYVLKARITDVHGGTVDEVNLPIEMVTDGVLASGETGG